MERPQTAGHSSTTESAIGDRKDRHLDIVLAPRLAAPRAASGFDAVRFEHQALPELDFDAIDLSAAFLGRRLKAPLLISSMTGGPARSAAINERLAEVAQARGIALAVGSQRIAIEGRGNGGLDASLRRLAPDVPILANLGAAQFVLGYGIDEARRAVDMIEADALIVHLNPLQEAVQAGGDRNWKGALAAIEGLVRGLSVPVVVKEVGAGLSADVARRLVDAGVGVLDVAGAGGTSWAAVEAERAATPAARDTALLFADWGIPTATAIAAVRAACPGSVVVGSGGVRHGLDVARAIRLGADLAGQAAAGLAAAEASAEAIAAHFERVETELRIACFCTGSKDLAALRTARLLGEPHASPMAPAG
ncbi:MULTISPECIES: type 2 isopentenyl-diphosphate Delta-isomerase [unclassified Aureimonas]|uniref:type 2 isopentenyl-diphosphate Delta-isomerase n=1 Tax=unclassified Aureimonas TaxID=2615206 RepID=UPI0006F6A58C|nr:MULTISPECIES: type 2 isopentenyl-diphosphate Delta-isomerase [unclassified Aureimonas]KQT69690.1 isopentenyl pyrophosphate isomerase [Aureimonas sp. Leaf427]KQT76157.1 isopentenyl pyrophosphate isomerase [Aureimonas sp. Leaf460]